MIRRRPLFLRWTLINALGALFLGLLYERNFFDGLAGAPLVGASSIIAVTIGFTAYAGLLSWRADDILEAGAPRDKLLHDLDHIFHAIWVCQILGIIGALVGYREQTQTAAAASVSTGEAVQEVFSALGNGLIATMLGVLCSLLFFIEYRLLEHALGRN